MPILQRLGFSLILISLWETEDSSISIREQEREVCHAGFPEVRYPNKDSRLFRFGFNIYNLIYNFHAACGINQ